MRYSDLRSQLYFSSQYSIQALNLKIDKKKPIFATRSSSHKPGALQFSEIRKIQYTAELLPNKAEVETNI